MEKRLVFVFIFILLSGCTNQAPSPTNPKNPVVEYAKEKGVSDETAKIFAPLSSDDLQDLEKQAIDAIANLPADLREKAARAVMADGQINQMELEIVKASEVNADASPYLWNMSFMNSLDERTLHYIQFLNYVWSANPELAEKIMLDKQLTGYETKLLEVYEKNPAFAKRVIETELLIRDGKLTSVEGAYLLNPSKANEANVIKELLKPYKSPVLEQIKDTGLEVLDDMTVYPPERLEYEINQGHMGPDDFKGLNNLLTIYEPDGYAAYALLCLSGEPAIQDGINAAEKEIIPGSMKLDGKLPEMLNPLGGEILWKIAKSDIDVSQYPKLTFGITLTHEPFMEIEDNNIRNFILDQSYRKILFGIENEKDSSIPWKLEDEPFLFSKMWAFPSSIEMTGYDEANNPNRGNRFVLRGSVDYDYLTRFYYDVDSIKKIRDKSKNEWHVTRENDSAHDFISRLETFGRIFKYDETGRTGYFKSLTELLSEYEKNGFISGDCTSISTVRNGIANSLNYPSEGVTFVYFFHSPDRDLTKGIGGHHSIRLADEYLVSIIHSDLAGMANYLSSPELLEFDKDGNYVERGMIITQSLSVQSYIEYDDKIYTLWRNRWKK